MRVTVPRKQCVRTARAIAADRSPQHLALARRVPSVHSFHYKLSLKS